MTGQIRLITFQKPKYGEQIVAVVINGGPNIHLFDACDLFIGDYTWSERSRVKDIAKDFAERFVAQMNAGWQ